MAVLLRSVEGNAEPITRALQAAGIPFVVTGMTNLFGTRGGRGSPAALLLHGRPGSTRLHCRPPGEQARSGVDTAASARQPIANAASNARAIWRRATKRWGLYSIQRQFLNFLEDAAIREEPVPDGRGEVVFYNLGKFSQLISDFETIHFHSKPVEKYASFADFPRSTGAEDAYPEGWQDNQYANPDAVRIMTVHQAKGMQWPVVFVPALLRNRFPAKTQGGRKRLAPASAAAVKGQAASRARSRTNGGSSTSR